jgi:hypothetical protein
MKKAIQIAFPVIETTAIIIVTGEIRRNGGQVPACAMELFITRIISRNEA